MWCDSAPLSQLFAALQEIQELLYKPVGLSRDCFSCFCGVRVAKTADFVIYFDLVYLEEERIYILCLSQRKVGLTVCNTKDYFLDTNKVNVYKLRGYRSQEQNWHYNLFYIDIKSCKNPICLC